MFRRLKLSLLLIFFSHVGYAQNCDKVTVIQDHRIDKLITKSTHYNEHRNATSGYRVQIYFGNQREPAKETKSRFLSLYPEMKAHETYQQPNYKIRVGDFRNKVEAFGVLKTIQKDFPNAFIVQDDIGLEE